MKKVKDIIKVSWLWDIKSALRLLWIDQFGRAADSPQKKTYLGTKKNREDGCNHLIWLNDYYWMLYIIKIVAGKQFAPPSVDEWLDAEMNRVLKMFDNGFTNLSLEIKVVKKHDEVEANDVK